MATKSLAKLVGETFRDDKLVTRTARYAQQVGDDSRHRTGIYPAEMSHTDRCHRAVHYRLTGIEAQPQPLSLVTELIFNHGNTSHDWWQNNWWGMGILKGIFHCKACGLFWEDTSPKSCPRCEMQRTFLEYKEVPFRNKRYNMVGRADADLVTDGLVEIKTIGIGTIRHEAPHLIEKHGENWDAIWKDIKHPFLSHRKQGWLYDFFLERPIIKFIYDPKFVSAAPKEFNVEFKLEYVEDILKECDSINEGVAKRRTPHRPEWAAKDHRTCQRCPFRKTCYGTHEEPDATEN